MSDKPSLISAKSVKARLKKEAATNKKDFDFLLLHYFIERLLYRLSISSYANNFILKGGLLLYTILDNRSRATRDIDLLAKNIKNTPDELVKIFTKIVTIPVNDAVSFDTEKITVERIKENADYQGIRIKLIAYLDRSRHILQFDIGFGDVVIPQPIDIIYPTVLDMEPPKLKAYSPESVIAEKFQAIVYLADLNSRMKDFYDIYALSHYGNFNGPSLAEAILQTFKRRDTEISLCPVVFSREFSLSSGKQEQWQSFLRRTGIAHIPSNFSTIVTAISQFLLPVYESLVTHALFTGNWNKDTGLWNK